jgi:NAD(P)H-hydrate repair Nnr-like enzyme with NAD(P)H-hydrate dehydratase domain
VRSAASALGVAVPSRYTGESVGLATSWSGDTLAGIVAGLAARGAPAAHAAVGGAYLHGASGQALARRLGPIGYLARELLAELPPLR